MATLTISQLVGSSQYQAVADDTLKDEDNAAWVMELEPAIRDAWIERIGWIRLVDRLAEGQLIAAESSEFDQFYQGWQVLLTTGKVKSRCPYWETLTQIQACWFQEFSETNCLTVTSWDNYLKAIARYHTNQLKIHTLVDYETMLAELAGSFCQILPFLAPKYWQAAYYFGALDQFYNNLRDLREDGEQNLCYFPDQILQQFGVQQEEIIQGKACQNPGYFLMMDFWLNKYLPRLRRRAMDLLHANDLHPSWRILRQWSLHRYTRIEQIFRACNFDYMQFPHYYWQTVEQELPTLLVHVRQDMEISSHGWAETNPVLWQPESDTPVYSLPDLRQAFLNILGDCNSWFASIPCTG